jgi:type VI secretion system protein ImpA
MSDDILDIDALLAPLDGGDGAGTDLRQDYAPTAIYQKLRDARADARAEERDRDGRGETESAVANGWRDVRRLATTALETKTKDFEIAAWLTEALVRFDGLAGLGAGARLLTGLLAQHWDAGHPQPDEDGLEGRAAPLGGLAGGDADGTVMQALRRTPLFQRPSGEPLGLYQYEASLETAGIADEQRREQRHAQGVIPFDTIASEAPFGRAALRGVIARATSARADWTAFETGLEARFGADAPPTRRVGALLDRVIEVATKLGGAPEEQATPGQDGPVAEGVSAPGAGASPITGATTLGIAVPAGSLANREQALAALEQIASFFRKTEPHSFLAYTLTDAVRRGRMPLPELLAEVLADETARTAMLTALGIRPGALEENPPQE